VKRRIALALTVVAVAPCLRSDDSKTLPTVAEGFEVSLFAREPLVRNPVSMAFDARGRLFVGGGPQFRSPRPETPGDRIKIIRDEDGDGVADSAHVFADGFNCIQSLAWKGRDLWVANSPDLTIVRDLDGDDVADEYVLVYTDLGNLEHGIHGLVWAPDGKLYMSKGNSKGLTRPAGRGPARSSGRGPARSSGRGLSAGRIAPKPFRELWGASAPPGSPDFPPPRAFHRSEYRKSYHDPADDWGREGGVLRCDDLGDNLEIVCRGFRNPWDIAMDDGFRFLGTDNDQNHGDKIFMPFFGAHFGWGHPWSSDWLGHDHPPTVPASGPFFEGSGTGITYYDSTQFPPGYRGVFFINDWLRQRIYVHRPIYRGAMIDSSRERLEVLARADGALFKPSDVEVGPDGSLYVLGWGREYGARFEDGRQTNEGRIFRIRARGRETVSRHEWSPPKRAKPLGSWDVEELIDDLGHQIAAWRVNAQDELLRREDVLESLLAAVNTLNVDGVSRSKETWLVWTIGRLDGSSRAETLLREWADGNGVSLNRRLQAIRSLVERVLRGESKVTCLGGAHSWIEDPEPRVRFEAAQAIRRAGAGGGVGTLVEVLARETDTATYYVAWGGLRDQGTAEAIRELSTSTKAGQRRGALLAALELGMFEKENVRAFLVDRDPGAAKVASLWLTKVARDDVRPLAIEPGGGEFSRSMTVRISSGLPDATIRFTLDGSDPTDSSPLYRAPLEITEDTVVRAAVLRDRQVLGRILAARFHKLTEEELRDRAFVHDVKAASDQRYEVGFRALRRGEKLYTDRGYRFTRVPEALRGATVIRTANEDAGSRGEKFLRFSIAARAEVFLAHDERVVEKPPWIRAAGFEDSGLTVSSDDASFRLFRKEFDAGSVVLGGNSEDGRDGGKSAYVVIVKRTATVARATGTTVADVLPLLETAAAGRGRRVFFDEKGAHCGRCHRVGDLGKSYAPDLSDLGTRAPLAEIARSILTPSIKITEGFRTHVIVTRDAKSHVGLVLEESGVSLLLVDIDGEPHTIEKTSIVSRQRSEISAMPADIGRLLSPTQVADLVAFLGSCRGTDDSPARAPVTMDDEVRILPERGKLRVEIGGKPFVTYVHDDARIPRPYFAHVHSPSGVQVTRNHPPKPGDANDHATMHPGIWMAFGDISGNDFWRLRAHVEHDGLLEKPVEGRGAGRFVVRNRYVSEGGGNTVCRETVTYDVRVLREGYLLEWRSEFRSDDGDFIFGDQEEMGLGVRVATSLAVDRRGGGRILDAGGRRDGKGVWGRQSLWCDYAGPIGGRWVGVALLSDRHNPRAPWWHARDYGLLVANPFGRNAMTGGQKSRVVVRRGDKLELRFGVLVHSSARESDVDIGAVFSRFSPLVGKAK